MGSPSYKTLHRRAQFLYQLGRDLERISSQLDTSRVVRIALRKLGEALEADIAIQVDARYADQTLKSPYRLALTPRGTKLLERAARNPELEPAGPPFLEQCAEFLRRGIGPADRELLLVRIALGERVVAVLGFRRPGRNWGRADAFLGRDAAEIVIGYLMHRERERAQSVKERIYAKLLGELRPKDVLYQILHGLERLLQYDHSGSVHLVSPSGGALLLQAEIITWTKAKSDRIGRAYEIDDPAIDWLRRLGRPILLRGDATAVEGDTSASAPSEFGPWTRLGPSELPPESIVRALRDTMPGAPASGARILVPLTRESSVLGLLQIQGRSAAAFTRNDLEALTPFVPLAAVAVYNSELVHTQHERLISAERKVALADLARAISHDLNNAFGVMLPLIQTLRRDLADRSIGLDDVERDLEVLAHYAQMSARIFKGLLSVARGRAEAPRRLDLTSVLEQAITILRPSLGAAGIAVSLTAEESSPTVLARRGEMEQLFLNLFYNARDAMASQGGRIDVRIRGEADGVRIEIADTGPGIPEELRTRVFEPFFTTKEAGSGLGLDICRSIVWDYDGRLELDSGPGRGTTAIVWLPREAPDLARITIDLRPANGEPERERGA